MGQNFSWLEHGINCSDLHHAQMPMQCFIYVKVNFEKKKNTVLPNDNFLFLVLVRNTIMLQHLIIIFLLHYLSSGRLGKVRNTGKCHTFSSKSDCSPLHEVVTYKRFWIYWSDKETFCILENWSLSRDGRLQGGSGGSTVLFNKWFML